MSNHVLGEVCTDNANNDANNNANNVNDREFMIV